MKAEKREAQQKEKERREEMKKNDPLGYVQGLYARRIELLDKLEEVYKRKQELTSRRSTASQHRMRTIAALSIGDDKGMEDNFGKSDHDWEVYRGLSKSTLEEEELEHRQQLAEIEELLGAADPCNPSLLPHHSVPRRNQHQTTVVRRLPNNFVGGEISRDRDGV